MLSAVTGTHLVVNKYEILLFKSKDPIMYSKVGVLSLGRSATPGLKCSKDRGKGKVLGNFSCK